MSSTVLYMSMSLDGFVAGLNESPDNGLGDGGHRLHEWTFPGADEMASKQPWGGCEGSPARSTTSSCPRGPW